MFVTNTGGPDINLSEQEIIEAISKRNKSSIGQADVVVNAEVIVIQFVIYDSDDSDTNWILLRSNCPNEFIRTLLTLCH